MRAQRVVHADLSDVRHSRAQVLLSLARASAATCSSLGSEDIIVLLEKVLRKGPVSQAAFKALAVSLRAAVRSSDASISTKGTRQ